MLATGEFFRRSGRCCEIGAILAFKVSAGQALLQLVPIAPDLLVPPIYGAAVRLAVLVAAGSLPLASLDHIISGNS